MSTDGLPSNKNIVESAEILWQYMKINQALKPVELILRLAVAMIGLHTMPLGFINKA